LEKKCGHKFPKPAVVAIGSEFNLDKSQQISNQG
jgi:hypothetical protein